MLKRLTTSTLGWYLHAVLAKLKLKGLDNELKATWNNLPRELRDWINRPADIVFRACVDGTLNSFFDAYNAHQLKKKSATQFVTEIAAPQGYAETYVDVFGSNALAYLDEKHVRELDNRDRGSFTDKKQCACKLYHAAFLGALYHVGLLYDDDKRRVFERSSDLFNPKDEVYQALLRFVQKGLAKPFGIKTITELVGLLCFLDVF